MKLKLKPLVTAYCLLIGNLIFGQNKIVPLKIGDRIPNLVLNNILNHSDQIKISDLHNQDLLIINFWATWCVPCIRELPTLDTFAVRYKGKIKILSVAYESTPVVQGFLKKHPELPLKNILISTGDKILIQYFRHRVIPHNVWIDKNGVIKNITGEEEINIKAIEAFLSKGYLKGDNKTDKINFDMYSTFHLKDTAFIYRSILTGFTEGINGGTSYQTVWHHPTERWISRFFTFNSSKQQILWRALNNMNSFKDYYKILKIETSDSTRFFWPKENPQSFAKSKYKTQQEWRKENLYCYELTLPKAVKDTSFFNFVISDLERTFEVSINKEDQMIPVCIIGIKNKQTFAIPQSDSSYIDLSSTMLKVHNVQILRLFQFLNEKVKPDLNSKPIDPPFIDNTDINHRIDLQLTFDKEKPSYDEIKALIFNKYGFYFTIKEQKYPIFIVKDLVQLLH